jgi:SNF2 family DNA or RNA helicase
MEGRRVILFSDYEDTFKPVVAMLRRTGTQYVELDGGNVHDLDAAQLAFTSGSAPVLLVNSAFYGAGMNLQCASDVVFMHHMSDATEKQVVGRAQRPGRIGQLRVWQLLYTNEAQRIT